MQLPIDLTLPEDNINSAFRSLTPNRLPICVIRGKWYSFTVFDIAQDVEFQIRAGRRKWDKVKLFGNIHLPVIRIQWDGLSPRWVDLPDPMFVIKTINGEEDRLPIILEPETMAHLRSICADAAEATKEHQKEQRLQRMTRGFVIPASSDDEPEHPHELVDELDLAT